MDVAKSNSQSVRCVERPGKFLELEQFGNHELDLLFRRLTAPDDRFLHL